jgi:hypothetical protein
MYAVSPTDSFPAAAVHLIGRARVSAAAGSEGGAAARISR